MEKIPTMYARNPETFLVFDQVVPGCEWVLTDWAQVKKTVKWDGTSCLVRGGQLLKRYTVRPGKNPPSAFEPCGERGQNQCIYGWLPAGSGPENQYHWEAFDAFCSEFVAGDRSEVVDGTYELIGPKIQGNPYQLDRHVLKKHGEVYFETPGNFQATFTKIRELFEGFSEEGLVFYHPDGRRAKLKRKDFGFRWPVVAGVGQ